MWEMIQWAVKQQRERDDVTLQSEQQIDDESFCNDANQYTGQTEFF